MKNIIILLVVVFSTTLHAQKAPAKKQAAATTPTAQDKNAEKLLDQISKRYKAFKSIKADFTYTIENKSEKQTEKQKGTLYVKANKFRLEISGQVIICDNVNVWSYSKELNEVQVNKYNPKGNAIRIEDIFTMYNKGFLYKIEDKKKDGNGHEIVTIELTPKDKKQNYFKIKLTIDKTNESILKTIVYDKNGTIHTYSINNQVPNINLKESFFTFNKTEYPGVEVIDLR